MQRTARLPEDPTLVVRPQPRTAFREHALTVTVFAVTTAIAIVGVAATGSVVWVVIGLLCGAGLALEVLLVRAQLRFGPTLAADDEHLWLRTGGLLRPRSVQLAWSEISTVTLHLWHGRRGATARYLTFDLTDEAAAALEADPALARRASRLARTFGSPLAIAERQPDRFVDDALHTMRDLAPDSVRFARKT